ncbi:ATP-binding protein [Hymenobacter persicinus]|uniref:histidine kinase n=1 Tax=Hymenobacter persicinus TaxID=2025506 RepID=A0A4V1ZAL8_9BACT|nr:ATP-binding protein [Hymenobacter persicinus]RYU78704.1 HAMP domain-containing protein [Hymenobacter persicinus]
MSLKNKIRLSVFLLLLLLLGLGGYAFVTISYLEHGAAGLEQADFNVARGTVLAFLLAGTAVGVTMMVRLPRIVVRPLRRLTVDMERVAGPGTTTRVAVGKRDEVGTVAAAVNRVLSQAEDERRLTLAELFVERNRMEALVRSLDEGLLLLDEKGVVVLANPVACVLVGVPAAELLGRSATEVARTNETIRALLEPLAAHNLAGDNVPDPVFTFPHQGRAPHYQLSISPIEAVVPTPGKPAAGGHILCLRNVSDFKKLDQVKSNFLATISHELKTPLASINLSLMLLQDDRTEPEERQRIAGGIREETQRLLQMVGQLIDVSRLDAGADIKLNVQPVTLTDVVRYAIETVRPQLGDKQLELETQLPDTLPTAQADVEKTTWVLINLLANAIRYSPHGEKLLLRAVPWGDMVRVSIHDHGPGIAPEYHKRIFQRFAELPAAAGQRQGSSGLGLSISREFITAQGGRLWVESTAGKGSVFLFTLPLVAAPETEPAEA